MFNNSNIILHGENNTYIYFLIIYWILLHIKHILHELQYNYKTEKGRIILDSLVPGRGCGRY